MISPSTRMPGCSGADIPTIPYALRGLAYFEIRMQGPASDLHSGMFGGAVLNPANELARLIGGHARRERTHHPARFL